MYVCMYVCMTMVMTVMLVVMGMAILHQNMDQLLSIMAGRGDRYIYKSLHHPSIHLVCVCLYVSLIITIITTTAPAEIQWKGG